jgi:hypothetical protein
MIIWIAQEQKRINDDAERDNIRRLQRKVDEAEAELREAQLKRQNRVMK